MNNFKFIKAILIFILICSCAIPIFTVCVEAQTEGISFSDQIDFNKRNEASIFLYGIQSFAVKEDGSEIAVVTYRNDNHYISLINSNGYENYLFVIEGTTQVKYDGDELVVFLDYYKDSYYTIKNEILISLDDSLYETLYYSPKSYELINGVSYELKRTIAGDFIFKIENGQRSIERYAYSALQLRMLIILVGALFLIYVHINSKIRKKIYSIF
ncbi:MAG: hypothetical protein R3Y32_05480 [Bacillota bacterium]